MKTLPIHSDRREIPTPKLSMLNVGQLISRALSAEVRTGLISKISTNSFSTLVVLAQVGRLTRTSCIISLSQIRKSFSSFLGNEDQLPLSSYNMVGIGAPKLALHSMAYAEEINSLLA
jgi:hypothetical protein